MPKRVWNEERQKAEEERLEAHGITDPSKAYLLEPLEKLEARYEKKDKKKEAAFGWDVFNQKSLYNAYKKRTGNVEVDMEAYEAAKAADPEFYRDGDSMLYGTAPNVSADAVDRMVAELNDRQKKRKEFSRRRAYHEAKDVDSISDRNAHFNKKVRGPAADLRPWWLWPGPPSVHSSHVEMSCCGRVPCVCLACALLVRCARGVLMNISPSGDV